MAAYPTLPLLDGSAADRDSGVQISRATNGRLRQRRMFSASKSSFTLKHWLTAAELAALTDHYAAHKDIAFAFTWPEDGSTSSCTYGEEPSRPRPSDVPGYVLVDVKLMEV